ncbi:MAG: peptidoglycan recognition family protein [Candidatus Cybelea sp.]
MIIKSPNYPPPAFAMTPRDVSQITYLIIHHSDGPPDQDPLAIDQEHRAEGWAMIGYNFVIAGDGTVYQGRPTNVVPAAAEDLNTPSIDVCLLGDFEPGTDGFQSSVPVVQLQALKDLSVEIHQHYPTIGSTIGHRDVSGIAGDPSVATACPGDILYAEIPAVKAYTAGKLDIQ